MRTSVFLFAVALAIGGCNLQAAPPAPPPPQPQSKFQVTALDGNHALIIDNQTGDLWYFIDAPIGVRLRYAGKMTPASAAGVILDEYRPY